MYLELEATGSIGRYSRSVSARRRIYRAEKQLHVICLLACFLGEDFHGRRCFSKKWMRKRRKKRKKRKRARNAVASIER